MVTPQRGDTTVLGAQIAVVAVDPLAEYALAALTVVAGRALVAIAALRLVRFVETAGHSVAAIVRALVSVFAFEGSAPDAEALLTLVCSSAHIVIAARLAVVHVHATRLLVAAIVGARIAVVADNRHAGHTSPTLAFIANGTLVAVVAGEPLVVGGQRALTCLRIARSLQTDGLRTLRRKGAVDDAVGVHRALVGQLHLVAVQNAVAQVPVLQSCAVRVFVTLALHLVAGTASLAAGVAYRARVSVVTRIGVVLGGAAPESIADVVGARVVVVTRDGEPYADPILAMISDRASIAVDTLSLGQRQMLAPGFTLAAIIGARVVVITDVGVFSLGKCRFIGFLVAIVVHAVARFRGRDRSITVRQPLFGADSLAPAHAEFVDDLAESREPQLHRPACTGTDSCIGHALSQNHPVDGNGLLAGETPGARLP